MSRLLLLLALAVAACGPDESPQDEEPTAEGSPTTLEDTSRTDRPPPPTPFDAADAVFDTIEPPEQIVQFPPRPTPRPQTPIPRPVPPPPPPTDNPSGSCDVRQSEGYCLSFAGRRWTQDQAREVCDAAPDGQFGPGACPIANRIATCAFEQPSSPGQEIVYTYYAPYELTLAELACPGRFTRLE